MNQNEIEQKVENNPKKRKTAHSAICNTEKSAHSHSDSTVTADVAEEQETQTTTTNDELPPVAQSEIKEEDLNSEIFYFPSTSHDFALGNSQHYEIINSVVDSNGTVNMTESFTIPFDDERMNELVKNGDKIMEFDNVVKMPSNKNEPSHYIKYKQDGDGKTVKVWACAVCEREFSQQYVLMRHLPTHTDERNFQCKQCGKAFRQMSTLSQHRAIHSKSRPHVCEVCRKTFNRVSTLISHRKTHNGLKPHCCHLCNKAFHQKGNLRNHIFTHTNERPYKCDVCQKGFNQMSNLMCHKYKAHQRAGKQAFVCLKCDKQFDKRIALRNHEQYEHGRPGASSAVGNANLQPNASQTTVSPSVKYTNGVLVSEIDTPAMRHAVATNQVPFALLKPLDGFPLLVRVLPAGNKQMLVPATAEDLKKYGQISIKEETETSSDKENCPTTPIPSTSTATTKEVGATATVYIRMPVVASVTQRKRHGVVHMHVESPGPGGETEVEAPEPEPDDNNVCLNLVVNKTVCNANDADEAGTSGAPKVDTDDEDEDTNEEIIVDGD